jgi:hypothetical protein
MSAALHQQPAPVVTTPKRRPAAVKVLIALLGFLGLEGLAGGVGLAADPSGGVFGYPVSWLERTPFNDFLIPGLLLGLLLGVAPLVAGYGLLRRPVWRWTDVWNGWTGRHWAWTSSIIVGCGLVAWIIVQVLVVPDHGAAATGVQVYAAMQGVAIVFLAALRSVRDYYASGAD